MSVQFQFVDPHTPMGANLVADGATSLGGKLPVNPSGGLESRGHPVAASGLAQIHELVLQLRGDAPEARSIGNDRPLALTHNLGGYPGEMVSFISILGNELGTLHHDARTCQRGIADPESVIDLKTALDVDKDFALGAEKAPPLSVGPIRIAQAFVLDEVPGVRGRAAFGEIFGRCADNRFVGRERPRHHGGIGERTDAYGGIDAVLDQVDHSVAQRQLDCHVGVDLHEVDDGWCKTVRSKSDRGCDPQPSTRHSQGFFSERVSGFGFLQQTPAMIEVVSPEFGQALPAGRAVDQP